MLRQPPNCDVDESRLDLDPVSDAARAFGREERRTGAREAVEHDRSAP